VHHYAQEIVARWRTSDGEAVDVSENIQRAVGNIIWHITFGVSLEFDNPVLIKFRELQAELLPKMGGPLMMFVELFPSLRRFDFLFGHQMRRLRQLFDGTNVYLIEGIKQCESSFNADNRPSCYTEAFLAEKKRREEAGIPEGNFHFMQLLCSAATLWGAGFDTSVSVIRMAVLELVNNPEAQTRIQKEIDDVIGARRISFEDLKLMPYTHAFLQEVYRLGNALPLNFMRKTSQAVEIDGHIIPAGTTILPQFSMVHTDPSEFERPDFFCPERHLNDEGQFVKDPRITPFSMGKRSCLGEQLARMEIFVMLTTFVQTCTFSPIGPVPPPIEFTTGFSRQPCDFRVKIQPRN
ncbi:hypothetical protein PMAYCL1PPCAC_22045, partial [Pristionchus mayeri]